MFTRSQLLAVPALLAASACAQSLTTAISGNSNLTSVSQLLSGNPNFASAIAGASNITILLPSNSALQAYMGMNGTVTGSSSISALLQYHVLNGSYKSSDFSTTSQFVPTLLTDSSYTTVTGGQRVEARVANGHITFISGDLYNCTITTPDIQFDGGYIQIVDRMLVIPPKLSARPDLSNDGVTVSALYNLLSTTNLLDTISNLSDTTIFAPSDNGLSNAAGQLAALSGDSAIQVAKYHVVQNQGQSPVYTTKFPAQGNMTLTTLEGGNLTITTIKGTMNNPNTYYVNGAKIVATNWLASGGVLHIIDNVLSPSNSSTYISTPSIAAASGSSGNSSSSSSSTGKKSAAGKGAAPVMGFLGAAVMAAVAMAL